MRRTKRNKINISRGFGSLTAFISVVSVLVFGALNVVYYVESLGNYVDLSFLDSIVSKTLPLNLFLIGAVVVSLLISLCTFKLCHNLKRDRGGFVIFLELVFSVALIASGAIVFGNYLDTLNVYVNYLFSFIVLCGAFGVLFAIIATLHRFNEKRKLERKARQFERNYMRNHKYNR